MTKLHDDSLLARVHEHALDFLRSLPERHVGGRASRDELLAELNVPFSETGEDPHTVIDSLASTGERGATASAGPRYFGFVIGGSLPVALAADWLTSAWDQNSGIFATSRVVAVAEEIAARWLLDLFDLPRDSGVGFVTGCQMANFTALAAARHAVLRRVGWNVELDGLIGAPRVNLVVSAESHVTIHTSMRMLGFGTRALQTVETDGQGRMKPEALRALLENLSGPTIVCAQAGNVNTGAVDPLREIAQIAREHDAWLHIDGAFGLWGRTSRDRTPLLDGIELADSWATDAHKWLNVPYDCGIVIVRDAPMLRAAMTVKAEYLEQTTGAERDSVDWVPDFSRRARGVTVYAALRALGRRGVEEMIDRGCARARQFADILGKVDGIEVLNDVVLNQVLVRFAGDDEITRETIAAIQNDGTCWLAGTTWHGLAAMRISVSHWATSEEDVARSAEAMVACFRKVAAARV